MEISRKQAIYLAAAREMDDCKRWHKESMFHGVRASKRFRLDAEAARMRAERLMDHLRTGKKLPRDLEDAVRACMIPSANAMESVSPPATEQTPEMA